MQEKDNFNKSKDWLAWLVKGNNRVKFFFFILSVFLWFLIKLSKPGYVNEFKFPLKFVNLPQNKLLVERPQAYADISLRGDGFTLLKYALTSFNPVEVNLSTLSRKGGGKYYWLPPANNKVFNRQLTDGVLILTIEPDTLSFELSSLSEKKIPVRAKISIDPKLGQKLYRDPQIMPDSVFIAGPEKQIDKIEYVETAEWFITEKGKQKKEKKLALKWVEANEVRTQTEHVTVKIDLASLTEEIIKVPVLIENVPDSLQLEVFPKQVQIRYRVPLRDFEKVQAKQFAVVVNFKDLSENPENRFLNLHLDDAPEFIEQVILDPKRVEFIITKK